MHITSFTIPSRPTARQPGFYAGCTRDDFLSILYPHGRETATPAPLSVPASNGAKPKRKRLGGLVKSVSGLFRKRDKSKPKEPNTLVAEPISSTTELRTAGLMFDASEELDGGRYQAGAGLGSGSESADALNELIDAHSDSDLGSRSDSSDSIAWSLLPEFPQPPAGLTAPVPSTGRPNRPRTAAGFVMPSPASVSGPLDSQSSSTSTRTKRGGSSSLWLFNHRPESGEYNRKSVSRRALDAIKTPRLRPLRLSEKVRAEASIKARETSVSPSLVPDVVVTAYEDSTQVVFRLADSDYEDSEPAEPGLLFPDYIREHYPTPRRFTELPRLTRSTSSWGMADLMAIAEDEEDEEEEEFQSRFSDSDSEPDFTSANDSGSSSQGSSPPLTPMSVEMRLSPAVFESAAGKSTSSFEVDDRDNAVGVAL
ncbi:hypothetical protein FRC12_007962 [Ceratobasidium sp. 428]|nr:hypothetical protein FRC09_007905 [Ceratobasidium sp. 395]KAG8764669.1 hypothetical protein FRC12_007962 [Ceratobasidium sp. 428]